MILTTSCDGNSRAFSRILSLYVDPGSLIADVTFGKGTFWKYVPADTYDLKPTDILTGIDFKNLPYDDKSIDCVILDPPYMHQSGSGVHEYNPAFEESYRNNENRARSVKKYHDGVLDLYQGGGIEAYRVLRDHGVLIVKCQDEVCANRQRLTHVEIINMYDDMGFTAEDLFVTMRNDRPGVSRMIKQIHGRKNHSYFLVFWKRGNQKSVWRR